LWQIKNSQVIQFVVFEDGEAGGSYNLLRIGGFGFLYLKTADAFQVRLEDEAISVFDVDIVLGQGRGEQFEIADFVGD
jgi:hypothetical protein